MEESPSSGKQKEKVRKLIPLVKMAEKYEVSE